MLFFPYCILFLLNIKKPPCMRKMRLLLVIPVLFFSLAAWSQVLPKNTRYPSLLWEITGNGLKKPSYLFGTMHVSSKMAFNLADSFYIGIRNADIVALETNPESWQEDMSRYELGNDSYFSSFYGWTSRMPNDYLTINTFKFPRYEKWIQAALYSSPSVINNLLYRTYGNDASDFEEDTYLDMYIYQCGKRWGKKVAGVESYGESMKLMMEAYKDASKEKRKERSYEFDETLSPNRLQEAYRSGNLDLLDSINKFNSYSAAFDEKFLYRRNEIQAASIDSILRTDASLFVGVGAAHLPGQRGVIEILRSKGYRLRAVRMGQRSSEHKNAVEKIRVPVAFTTQTAADGFYKVDIPGKFYQFETGRRFDQQQYADMANGSYYMVTRISLSAWMWGHTVNDVLHKVDSLLYENIPGKILSKTTGLRNGYKMIDITNKTRRGDIQRYNIFVTPFELVLFKMSGTGDYVQKGEEAKRFFGSIQLKEYRPAATGWKTFSPSYGGFSVSLPHEPYTHNNGGWFFDAEDRNTNTQYRVIRTDIHNYGFAEEDTFDLSLMEESFASSEFIDTQLSRRQIQLKGYPALDCSYRDNNGCIYLVRFLIQGPHYYTLLARGQKETAQLAEFLNSFQVQPYRYGETKERVDTSLYYTVRSAVFPEPKKEKLELPRYNPFSMNNDDDDDADEDIWEEGVYRSKVIANDSTGEKIYVSFYKTPRYYYTADSTMLEKENEYGFLIDTSWIVREKRKSELPGNIKVWELAVSDTGSSRMIRRKTFFRNGVSFLLLTQTDTLSRPSAFVQSFFDSFMPADTLRGYNPFTRKSDHFFEDFFSPDSVKHKRAVRNIYAIHLEKDDFPRLRKAIDRLNWKEKKYLDTKKLLIRKLSAMPQQEASDYLKQLYYATADTVDMQYPILETLLGQKTLYAFKTFRDIVTAEPPVLNEGSPASSYLLYSSVNTLGNANFILKGLQDSLKLTRVIWPDLLPLINLDDYKMPLMGLLRQLLDSNLVKAKDYEAYFNKFLLEARQELKKQNIREKKKAIQKAEEAKEEAADNFLLSGNSGRGTGNDLLVLYARLLMPFWEKQPQVPVLLNQMLASSDKELQYNMLYLFLQQNKQYPDSLLQVYARSNEYRYELYTDLKHLKKQSLFPAAYNNHISLSKSKLLMQRSYNKPDTLEYLDRLSAEIKGKQGFVYFFRYKAKKDDLSWKMAYVGLLPADSSRFELFDGAAVEEEQDSSEEDEDEAANKRRSYSFAFFTDIRVKDEQEEPLQQQLKTQLKKVLYTLRKSSRYFYGPGKDSYDATSIVAEMDE